MRWVALLCLLSAASGLWGCEKLTSASRRAPLPDMGPRLANSVKLTFDLKGKDSYLPEQASQEYVWGIKVTDPAKFEQSRPDIFVNGKADVLYPVVNMNFVIFSPICPHLGCRFDWNEDANKFKCPCHGSQFTLDGEHIAGQGPADRGLDPLPLREQNGIAQIEWVRYKSTVADRIVISYQS